MSAAPTLANRITDALHMSDGTMPMILVVESEAERERANALLAGKHGNRVIAIQTRAEDAEETRRIVATLKREFAEPSA